VSGIVVLGDNNISLLIRFLVTRREMRSHTHWKGQANCFDEQHSKVTIINYVLFYFQNT
jgi:hypothetical protein